MLEPGMPILVTTVHRGVFMGFFHSQEGNTIVLDRIRNCVYWPAECKGFIGLATIGPLRGSRVGPAAERATLYNVTAILTVSTEALAKWESFPWN